MKPTEELMNDHKAIKQVLAIMNKIADKIRAKQDFNVEHVEKIVDFIKVFADKCHHGKEENLLFPELVKAGFSYDSGPVGVMMAEHTEGRAYVAAMALALDAYKSGNKNAADALLENMLNYANLLVNHIHKEDNILFPMAERTLSVEIQNRLMLEFEKVEEEIIGHGVHEQYHDLIKQLSAAYL